MAVTSGPCLLSVAFVAAAWVSGASSVPEKVRRGGLGFAWTGTMRAMRRRIVHTSGYVILLVVPLNFGMLRSNLSDILSTSTNSGSGQAGSSHKSVSCMPCSRTYIADAYIDSLTGQLAEQRDLTEVSDTADLCKGLTDDLDMPTVSEVHRQLVGEGSHRRLVYSVKFGNCKDAMVKFLDGYDANLVIIEKLPSGVFADLFELQHFVERKVFLDVAVFGDTNLELPSALSNRSAVEIHFDLKPSKSMDCNLVVELALHARYPPLDASGYVTVEFGGPDLLVRYRKKETHPGSCIWVLQNLNAAPLEKAVWRVPCGDEVHAGFVSSLTFVSALVCSMSIVLAASLIS
ncbi:hypothetical protein ACQ4PT_046295 [Festuca glaucescens]